MKDIDFFTEKNLNKTSVKKFHELLPDHLKDIFKGSLKKGIYGEEVLQGYRGPPNFCNGASGSSKALEPVCGIQEIRYWWGCSKLFMVFPILGLVSFAIIRTVDSMTNVMDWCSLYFDEKTGECLGSKITDVAKKLSDKADDLANAGDLSDAMSYLKNALDFTKRFGVRNDTIQENIEKVEGRIEAARLNSLGDELFDDGYYAHALENYQKAQSLAQNSRFASCYSRNVEKAEIEIRANRLHSEGIAFYESGQYKKAAEKIEAALSTSNVAKQKAIASRNLDIMSGLSSIEKLWLEAWAAENDTKSDRSYLAKLKFDVVLEEAKEYSLKYENVSEFRHFRTLAFLKTEGNTLFNDGIALQEKAVASMDEGDSALARSCLREAKSKFLDSIAKFKAGFALCDLFSTSIDCVRSHIESLPNFDASDLIDCFHQLTLKPDVIDGERELKENETGFANVEYFHQTP